MLFSIFQNNVVFDFVDAAATTYPLTLVMGAGSKINLGQIWISPPKNICVPTPDSCSLTLIEIPSK